MNKQEALNTPSEGLLMDLNPIAMPSNALTNCLNGTLLTYNGNENMLQNDMGNARVETAMLPTGYIPLGSTSLGGIIYIVSYNPIDKRFQIGSFPSPERNITQDELGNSSSIALPTIKLDDFCDIHYNGEIPVKWEQEGEKFGSPNNIITNYYQKVNLLDDKIYSGDKYKIFSEQLSDSETVPYISTQSPKNPENFEMDVNANPKYLRFEIISTIDDGKSIDLTKNSVWTAPENDDTPYYIYKGDMKDSSGKIDIDEYRGLVGSNYDVYNSKVSGKLGIIARLEVPTSFTVGYQIMKETNAMGLEYYQVYFYLNWANDLKDEEYKNRINPNGIIWKVKDTSGSIPIELPVKGDIAVKLVPDAMDELDYLTIEAPERYYNDSEYLSEYLQKLVNQPGSDKRHNDGTDFQYVVKGPRIDSIFKSDGFGFKKAYTIDGKQVDEDGIITLDIVPTMPFGQLEFLKRSISINMNMLYNGTSQLFNYQYYVDNNDITIDFQLEAYPDFGYNFSEGKISLYPLRTYINKGTNAFLKQSTYSDDPVKLRPIEFPFPPTYQQPIEIINGFNQITINRTPQLMYNTIYIAEISMQYGNSQKQETRYFYRILFNDTLFNNAYGTGQDFKNLYLYENGKNYGISLNLQVTDNLNNNVNKIDGEDFPQYLNTADYSKAINHTYEITHNVENKFLIESSLSDVSINIESLKSNTTVVTPDIMPSDERIAVSTPQSTIQIEPTGVIKFNNQFTAVLPYTLDYSKAESLTEYELTNLKCNNTSSCFITLQHYSSEQTEGYLTLFVNFSSTDPNKEANSRYELVIQDTGNSKSDIPAQVFSMNGIEQELQRILNDGEYDYLELMFGILYMGDNNSGYGYQSESGKQFRKVKKPYNGFAKVNYIRKNSGDGIIIHSTPSSNVAFFPVKEEDKGNPGRYILNYSGINSQDRTIIKTVGTSSYKKYKSTGERKTLYGLNNLEYITNPRITTIYSFNIDVEGFSISLFDNVPIEQSDETANNLSIKESPSFVTNLQITDSIYNQNIVNEVLSINLSDTGISTKGKLITYKDRSAIYDSLEQTIDKLVINDRGLVTLSDTQLANAYPTSWYFGWEDTGGDPGSIIYEDFAKSAQKYVINYTYSMPQI